MTVLQNFEYGMSERSDKPLVDRIIQITDIQKQRVAFARSVIRKPKLLLLDEPLSALDIALRSVLQNELLELRKLLDITVIFTSHSVLEVFKLADQALLIEKGQITKSGTPAQVFADGDNSIDAIGEFLSSQQIDGKNSV